jgi:predicted RNase H-like nuclease
MGLVLGIDAAWSPKNPSGVALVAAGQDIPRLVRAAPSYEHFMRNAPPDQWGERMDSHLALPELLAEAQRIAGEAVRVIAVDMPVALTPVRSRRRCDKAISTLFGANWCSTHSPTKERPGTISDVFLNDAVNAGFSLKTTGSGDASPALLEVYPHVALLALCNSQYRLRYKLSRRRTYWPDRSAEEGREEIRREWVRILTSLKSKIDMDLEIDRHIKSQRAWKAWEDVIDAIVCCWVGLEWLSGRARPYGDVEAAIWVPASQQGSVCDVA